MSILWWIALCFGCLSKKQYLLAWCTTGITWLTVRLTGLREVMHALFLFSSLFAFSCATFFNGHDSVMYWTEISLLDRQKLYFLAKLWDSKNFKTTLNKSCKLDVESFGKLYMLASLMKRLGTEGIWEGKICPLILLGQF